MSLTNPVILWRRVCIPVVVKKLDLCSNHLQAGARVRIIGDNFIQCDVIKCFSASVCMNEVKLFQFVMITV